MRRLRSVLFAAWLYIAMSVCGLTFAPFAIFNRGAVRLAIKYWAQSTLFGLRWIIGAKLQFEGVENIPDGPLLVAAKHQSMLDTLAPNLVLSDAAIVFKEELKKEPVFGWYLMRAKMIPIARDEGAQALKAMLRDAKSVVAEGRQILIFPEGTRKNIGDPPDYKSGIAALYGSLKLPCVPVALDTGLIWPAKGLGFRPGLATIRFLPPIPPGLSRAEFMTRLEHDIETETAALIARDQEKLVT